MELHQSSGLLATTGGEDGCVRLWRLQRLLHPAQRQQGAAQVACWAGHGASVTACCFTHCGRFVASAGRDGTVRLWQVSAHEPLAVLRLHAASLAFAPGDDAALLVAPDGASVTSSFGPAGSFGRAPVLLNLRSLPACRLYCSQLAVAQQGGSVLAQPVQQAAAVDPAVAVWLPSGGTPQRLRPAGAVPAVPAAAASVAAPTPAQPPPSSRTLGSGGSSEDAARRQVGRLATFGRRRQQQQQHREQQQAGRPAAEEAGGSDSWLPPDDTPVRPPLAASSRGMQLLASPLPSSPLSPAAGEAGLDAAVVALYDAPLAASGSRWDPAQRSYVAQHGGHAAPVCCILPLPTGLHVMTADEQGIAKVWGPSSGSDSSGGSSGSSGGCIGGSGCSSSGAGSRGSPGICCTLLPSAQDQAGDGQRCRPVVTPDGRHVLCGMPRGCVAVWEVEYAQQPATAPPDHTHGNASACCGVANCAVTAVAWDAGAHLLAAGDAAGHLTLHWL